MALARLQEDDAKAAATLAAVRKSVHAKLRLTA